MSAYAMGIGRPPFLVANRKLVTRRAGQSRGDHVFQVGEEMPQEDLTDRQVAVLWDQGWIDTLPVTVAPPSPQRSAKR